MQDNETSGNKPNESKKNEQANWKPALIGVAATLIGIAALASLLSSLGRLHFGPTFIHGAPGDPPITVSDGSLHAHSKLDHNMYAWAPNNAQDTTIMAVPDGGDPNTGSLYSGKGCGLMDPISGQFVPAALWDDADANIYPINAGAKITIIHDSENAPGKDGEIDITLPSANTLGPLTIKTNRGYFEQ